MKTLVILLAIFFLTSGQPIKKFRLKPTSLSESDVKTMLRKHNFYCQEYDWSKEYCNPNGTGYTNDFDMLHNGEVICDRASGLMWQQGGSPVGMKFKEIDTWIKALNQKGHAGFHDWRLPTMEEVMSLMEQEKTADGLHINSVFDKKQFSIWTSDKVTGESAAWVVCFQNGDCIPTSFFSGYYVRCVRFVHVSGK